MTLTMFVAFPGKLEHKRQFKGVYVVKSLHDWRDYSRDVVVPLYLYRVTNVHDTMSLAGHEVSLVTLADSYLVLQPQRLDN